MKTKRINREEWLLNLAEKINPRIEEVSGKKTPKFNISYGFPSRGALSLRRRVIGQCWSGLVSNKGIHEIFISPLIHSEKEVAATVAHELCHANIGTDHGHKKPFAKVAYGIGLRGKPTETVAGPEFDAFITPVLKTMHQSFGTLPHEGMKINGKYKAQPTRLLKADCPKSGYIVRVTSKWVEEEGAPLCPCHKQPMKVYGMGEK